MGAFEVKTLGISAFKQSKKFIEEKARPIERSIFENLFYNGSRADRVKAILAYQNEDGGFGNGIEPDFRLKKSSPMATSIGLRYLRELEDRTDARQSIQRAIKYLESTYDRARKGWYSVPKSVNSEPHAPWWNYEDNLKMTVIDQNWGNPSAEIIAYLYRYRGYLKILNINDLVENGIFRLESKLKFESEHEIYCYLKLYKEVEEENKLRIEYKLKQAIKQVLVIDDKHWHEYVPMPLDFVKAPDHNKFGIEKEIIESQLDFLVDEIEKNGCIKPPWGESFYSGDLSLAYDEWIGKLTLRALRRLSRYGRLTEECIY